MSDHGPFVPEGVRFRYVPGKRDIHRVWLYVPRKGSRYRKRVEIGQVRRCPSPSDVDGVARQLRHWRAFSVLPEFPPVFSTHYEALCYLKQRWEAAPVIPRLVLARPRETRKEEAAASAEGWVSWLGRDPFAG